MFNIEISLATTILILATSSISEATVVKGQQRNTSTLSMSLADEIVTSSF